MLLFSPNSFSVWTIKVIRDAQDNERKALTISREHYLSKGKPKVISLYTELSSLRKLESEFITDYIIRTENISNTLKESGEVISNGLLITMTHKGLPPNFKPFTMVITQKKKTLTFSEFKVCLKSNEETEHMCHPTEECNNILKMKTTFKKINPRNKPGVECILTMIINQQIIITTITRNLIIVERTIKFSPREDKYYLLHLWEEGTQSICL